jgi:tRNA modification GTPase
MSDDTIYALSSGAGAAGIAIIRISGPRAADAASTIAGSMPRPRQAALRRFRDPENGETIDSGLLLFFPGPGSITGEDLVELHGHGSLAVVRRLLAVLGGIQGLRQADPGEFTARAFDNGRMDLIEVEALGDLLAAETISQARMALTYQARLRDAAAGWRDQLVDLIALTEAYIDFSDEGDVQAAGEVSIVEDIRALATALEQATASLATGERIRRGYRVALLGAPNAGKSSLVNALAQRDVAITSAIPGTTRDAIEVHLDLDGFAVVLVDTAGIRESEDALERAGIERTHTAAAAADLVIWLSAIDSPVECPYSEAVSVISKSDLAAEAYHVDSIPLQSRAQLAVSARTGVGLSDFIEMIRARASASMTVAADALVVANARQANELSRAGAALGAAAASEDLEIRAEHLRHAAICLDRLVGKVGYEEILGAIFARFCVGK